VPWISPTIFSLIGASILLTVVVGWWLKRAPEPFLPLNVLANPVMKLGTAATSFAMAVMTGFMIYMPLYYQQVHGLSPTAAGAALIPIIVLTTPGSMMSGRAMMYLTHYKVTACVGMTLATLAVAAQVIWPAMPLAWSVVATGLIGFGVGTVFPVATVSIQNAVDRHDVGAATGAMNFFRALGGALIVAIMGAILLAGLGVTPERGGTGLELTMPQATTDGTLAVAEVYRLVFVAALVFAVIALIAVVLLEERPLAGPAKPEPAAPVPPPAPAE
jgi:predicted MFS family arabinose efflux permease